MNDLSKWQSDKIAHGHCPVCDYRGFVLGPRGGAAINIECGNTKCAARFNVVRLPDGTCWGQTIQKRSDGGAAWYPESP